MRPAIWTLVLALLSGLMAFDAPHAGPKWMEWNEAYTYAQKHKKIVLVDVYTDWCGWCKRMDADTYAEKDVIEAIRKDFVAVKFNPETAGKKYTMDGKEYEGRQFQYVLGGGQINGYPATVFLILTKDGPRSFVQPGYHKPADFITLMKSVKDNAGKM